MPTNAVCAYGLTAISGQACVALNSRCAALAFIKCSRDGAACNAVKCSLALASTARFNTVNGMGLHAIMQDSRSILNKVFQYRKRYGAACNKCGKRAIVKKLFQYRKRYGAACN